MLREFIPNVAFCKVWDKYRRKLYPKSLILKDWDKENLPAIQFSDILWSKTRKELLVDGAAGSVKVLTPLTSDNLLQE